MSLQEIDDLSRDQLIGLLEDASLNWLAHDGLWFQAVESKFGTNTAIDCAKKSIGKYSELEANRIKKRFGLTKGGIQTLIQALKFRMYHLINEQKFSEVNDKRCVFYMVGCRVQKSRQKKGLPDYPCKMVGIEEYTHFAHAIDPRIKTRCLACPPDKHTKNYWCAWEFYIEDD